MCNISVRHWCVALVCGIKTTCDGDIAMHWHGGGLLHRRLWRKYKWDFHRLYMKSLRFRHIQWIFSRKEELQENCFSFNPFLFVAFFLNIFIYHISGPMKGCCLIFPPKTLHSALNYKICSESKCNEMLRAVPWIGVHWIVLCSATNRRAVKWSVQWSAQCSSFSLGSWEAIKLSVLLHFQLDEKHDFMNLNQIITITMTNAVSFHALSTRKKIK